MVGLLILLLVIVLFMAAFAEMLLSQVLAKPARELTKAMKAFEKMQKTTLIQKCAERKN